MSYWRRHWFGLLLGAALVVPALVCQTVWPAIAPTSWELLSEGVYAALLHFQTPTLAAPSRVLVLEVDQKTLDTYGWPIDRGYYVSLLDKLSKAGHPWVLSLLQFQTLERAQQTAEARQQLASRDAALATAITSYERYVGTGLAFETGAELSAEVESTLMPRVVLTKDGKPLDSLPYLPLKLVEDLPFVLGQRAFGFGTHFGLSPMVRCMQFYLTDARHTGTFALPSSLAWVAALANNARIVTKTGAHATNAAANLLHLGFKECLSSPGVLTRDLLTARRIERQSLASFLQADAVPDLSGRVVVLARSDMRRFRGPGAASDSDDGVIEEHLLAARFLDGLLSGTLIHREDSTHTAFQWLPLALAGVLAGAALFMPIVPLIFLVLAQFVLLLAIAAGYLTQGTYLVPLPAMSALALTALALGLLYLALRFHTLRRTMRLTDNLRKALSSCNTFAAMEAGSRAIWSAEVAGGMVAFGGFDRELYEAVNDPAALLDVLERRGQGGAPAVLAIAPVDAPKSRPSPRFGARAFHRDLTIASPAGDLGMLAVSALYKRHEDDLVAALVHVFQNEVSEHWHRIKLLVDQKLLDYKFLAEQSRVDILERFLTKVLVARFSDSFTMAENLAQVLTPRRTRAALMQADIRGYSRVSETMEPLAMVRLLQGYFRNVVDAASAVAQVKLIGDCIFLFIEDQAAGPGSSPADLAFELAQILIRETREQNALRGIDGGEELNFGIAIHYGEVVVGNLSSDSCIDYTVISPNVNLVARLEELTKNPRLASVVGKNGVILSNEAMAALVRYRHAEALTLVLADLGVTVRSFTGVTTVRAFTADAALLIT